LKKLCILLPALLIIFLSSGCFVLGTNKNYHPFDSEALDNVQPGVTTARDIVDLFGAPTEVVEMSNGNAYLYQRSIAKGTVVWLVIVSFGNYDTQVDQIVFFFDKNDVLTHYGMSLNAKNAKFGLPF
jgi:outer membrane protein assembly factor BamE (lipoprotein component of BamABCDE complex)